MNDLLVFILCAGVMALLALYSFAKQKTWIRKILAIQIFSNSISLFLITSSNLSKPVDPLPQALVITGIVVLVSTTAFALSLAVKIEQKDEGGEKPHA